MTRTCSRCKEEKSYLDFVSGGGSQYRYCRDCRRDYQKELSHRLGYTHPKKPRLLKYEESRKKVIEALGGRCSHCGFEDFRALQIDHKEGGGLEQLRSMTWRKYHEHVLDSLKAGLSNYQCLCANCNWIKRSVKNENPRQPPSMEKILKMF